MLLLGSGMCMAAREGQESSNGVHASMLGKTGPDAATRQRERAAGLWVGLDMHAT
jgi:hypothetical protein